MGEVQLEGKGSNTTEQGGLEGLCQLSRPGVGQKWATSSERLIRVHGKMTMRLGHVACCLLNLLFMMTQYS